MKRLIFGTTIVFFTILSSVNFSYAVNRVLSLDGTNGYVEVGADDSLDAESAGSISLWYYAHTAQGGLVSRITSSSWPDARMVLSFNTYPPNPPNGPLLWGLADGTDWQAAEIEVNPTLNSWIHLALTWDGSNVKAYKNGALVNAWPQWVTPEVTGVNLWIGRSLGLGVEYFDGLIDEASIWNKALTQEDIQKTMNAKLHGDEEGLVGYWNFDDGTADDLSPDGNHGTLMGEATIIPPINRALDLDGDGDYVEIANSPSLNPTNQITVETWYKPTVSFDGGNIPIVDKPYTTHSEPYYQYHLGVDGNTHPTSPARFQFWISILDVHYSVATPYNFWELGNWYHIAGVYDGNKLSFYVNGELIQTRFVTGALSTYDTNVRIGAFVNLDAALPGIVDEVRIWNRALTQMEIWAQKDAILKGDEPGLVGYWRLDEPPGSTIAHDSSGNGNDGTLYGDADFVVSDAPLSTGALVSISNVSGQRGKTVNVPVIVENITGIVSLDLVLSYDENILIPGVAETTDLTAEWKIDSYITTPGAFKVSVVHDSQPTEDGAMINIPFAVNPNASACITTPITIEQALLNEGHIPITTFDGIFSVMSRLGDVSLNGSITGYDAALVLQHTVQIIALTDCQQNAADVDISGEVTAYDAAIILQYVVGRISSLPPAVQSPSLADVTMNDAQIVLPYVDFGQNQPIIVPIAIKQKRPLVSAVELTLSYGGLKPTKVEKTALTRGYALAYNIQNGEVKIALAGSEPIQQNGAFVQVEFEPPSQSTVSQLKITQIRLNRNLLPPVVTSSGIQIPQRTALLQNFPNPFNPETWIPYELANEAEVTIRIYNLKGQLIRALRLGSQPAGSYLTKDRAAYWNGRDNVGQKVSSGLYFYTITADNFTATKRMILVK